MRDLRILEIVVFFLLFPPLIAPFFRKLREISGLNWLYPLTLVIIAVIFPLYGFRPECIPLLLLCALSCVIRLVGFVRERNASSDSASQKRGVSPALILLPIFLTISTAAALYFSPAQDTALISDGVRTVSLYDETRGIEFEARIYGEHNTKPNGLMLVAPPLAGSFKAVDKMCAEISRNGFAAATFSRRKTPVREKAALFSAAVNGTVFAGANAAGRRLEAERLADIRFMADALDALLEDSAAFPPDIPLFVIGYGVSGSALVYFLDEASAPAEPTISDAAFFRNLQGIITVESRFWSLYSYEDESVPAPSDAVWFQKLWHAVSERVTNLFPKKLNHIETAPIMRTSALFLTSDNVRHDDSRHNDPQFGIYAALLETLHKAEAPALLLAANGAGYLDYTDYPATQPLYSALALGAGARFLHRGERLIDTARLITDFASGVLDGGIADENFERTVFGGLDGIYTETR